MLCPFVEKCILILAGLYFSVKVWLFSLFLFVFWLLLGGDLCEVSASLCGSLPAVGGAELPCYRHPQGYGTGGEVSASYLSLQDFW